MALSFSGLHPARERVARGSRVQVVPSAAGLDALRPEYDRLNELAGNTLPFALHEWHAAWWSHFPTASSRIRDALRVHVVRGEGGECIAIVPFVFTQRPGVGPLRVGSYSLLGDDPYITELRKPLVAPGHEAAAATALRRHLAGDPAWDWICWSGIQGEFGQALARGADLAWEPSTPSHVLDLPASWETLRAGLKRNIRESLRHCYNSLKRDNLSFAFEVAETRGAVAEALDTFFALHAMRARHDAGIVHADRFGHPRARLFLRDVCDRMASRGAARVFVLRVGGRAVAARVAFVVRDCLYLYFSGFDPEWGKYSVMTTTVAEAIKYAIAQRLATVNLSAGTDVSKTRWGAREVLSAGAFEARPSARSRIAYAAYRTAKNATGTPWLSPILKWLPARGWG